MQLWLCSNLQKLRKSLLTLFGDEVARGCGPVLKRIYTEKWLDDNRLQHVLVGTLEDYYRDFDQYLDSRWLLPLSACICNSLTKSYLLHVRFLKFVIQVFFCAYYLSKKLNFQQLTKNCAHEKTAFKPKRESERRRAGDQMKAEAKAMDDFLQSKLCPGKASPAGPKASSSTALVVKDCWFHPKHKSPFQLINEVADLIGSAKGVELDVNAKYFAKMYPDVR